MKITLNYTKWLCIFALYQLHITPCIMVSSTKDHYPILGPNACLRRKATICFERSMKEYVGLTKLKTPLSGRPYYKATIGLVCRRTHFSLSRGALSVNSSHGSCINHPTFSTQSKVHGPLPYGEWISWDHSQFPHLRRSS